MFHCINIALLALRFISVILFDFGLLDIAPFNVGLFNVHYLMFTSSVALLYVAQINFAYFTINVALF